VVIKQPTVNQSTINTYVDGNIDSKFDTYVYHRPERRGHSRLPHFEHATNVITVVNAQLRVIQGGTKVCIK